MSASTTTPIKELELWPNVTCLVLTYDHGGTAFSTPSIDYQAAPFADLPHADPLLTNVFAAPVDHCPAAKRADSTYCSQLGLSCRPRRR